MEYWIIAIIYIGLIIIGFISIEIQYYNMRKDWKEFKDSFFGD